jgi:hypothetical protein
MRRQLSCGTLGSILKEKIVRSAKAGAEQRSTTKIDQRDIGANAAGGKVRAEI